MLATGEVKCIDEEVPFEIPKGWEWTRVGNIFWVTKLAGFEYTKYFTKDAISSFNTVPIVRAQNVRTGRFEENNNEAISLTLSKQLERSSLTKKCLLMTFIGAGIGDVCIFHASKRNHLAPNVAKIEPFNNDCFLDYYLIALMSPLGQYGVESIKKSTAQPSLSMETIRHLLIPVPSLAEQKRIVIKWDALYPLIDKYNKEYIEYDKLSTNVYISLRKSILQEAIQGKLVPQKAEEGTAKELLKQIHMEKQKLVKEGKLKKSAINSSVIFRGDDNKYWEKKGTTCECIDEDIPFDVPKSWAWVRLETILNTGSARRVHAKDWRQKGIPFYRAREIGKLADDGFVDNELYIDLSLYEDFSSCGVPLPNDLMITAVGTLGKVYIVKESDKFYYKDGSVLCLANKYELCAEYLKMVIESPFFKGQYRQESQGTTVATLTMVRLQKYFIPIPPLQEQYRIVETYRNIASIMSK